MILSEEQLENFIMSVPSVSVYRVLRKRSNRNSAFPNESIRCGLETLGKLLKTSLF